MFNDAAANTGGSLSFIICNARHPHPHPHRLRPVRTYWPLMFDTVTPVAPPSLSNPPVLSRMDAANVGRYGSVTSTICIPSSPVRCDYRVCGAVHLIYGHPRAPPFERVQPGRAVLYSGIPWCSCRGSVMSSMCSPPYPSSPIMAYVLFPVSYVSTPPRAGQVYRL